MTTSTVAPEIVEFAAAVRTALADLPAEERDELTDGLEADLSESLAEDLRRTLPDPVAYAAELRAAAGLPVRAKLRSGLGASWRETVADVRIAIRSHPLLHSVFEFLAVLRPAWWLIRAWVAYYLVFTGNFLGDSRGMISFAPLSLAMFLLFVVISVQWGRGEWLPRGGLPWLIGAGNVLALVLLLPAIAHANTTSSATDALGSSAPAGTAIDGEQVTNVFAYDAHGNPLRDVQLFDQSGKPLNVGPDTVGPECNTDCSAQIVRLPRYLDNGTLAWNTYPLREADEAQTTFDDRAGFNVLNQGESGRDATRPFVKVPAVLTPRKVAKSNH